MLAHAVTLGCAIPSHDFDATVHSVFRRACNLQIAGGGLVTLLNSKLGKLPQGIMISLPIDFNFESAGFRRGHRVTCRDGIICIDSLPYQIDLTTASRWRADLQSHPIRVNQPAVRNAWAVAFREWCQATQSSTTNAIIPRDDSSRRGEIHLAPHTPLVTTTLSRKAQSIVQSILPLLARAVRDHDLELSRHHAARLIGLGVGLTPSGDDALVGFLAGLWSTFTTLEDTHFLTTLGKEIISLSSNTNDISRAYLIHAARGQVSSVLENLCYAIARGVPAGEIRHATRAAVSVGHTSGADGVGGLLASLEVSAHLRYSIRPLQWTVLPSRAIHCPDQSTPNL